MKNKFFRLTAPFIFLFSLSLFPFLIRGQGYKVYAISYGRSLDFQKQLFVASGEPSERINFEWMFWVIRGRGRVFLVDTGFTDKDLARKWGLKEARDGVNLLSSIQIRPEDVSDIILTHAHWDHAGNLGLFPRARVWMQRREYEHMRKVLSKPKGKEVVQGYHRKDFEILEHRKASRRLTLVEGTREIAPGISVMLRGGHTPGSQTVKIMSGKENVFLLSDTAYFYENIDAVETEKNPFNRKAALTAIHDEKRQAGIKGILIPGHDPKVFERFFDQPVPSIAEISSEKALSRLGNSFLFKEPAIPSVIQRMKQNKQDLHLLLVGDINLGRLVGERLKGRGQKDTHSAFPWVRSFFQLADLRFGNLECVLTDHPAAVRKGHLIYLTADPELAPVLKDLPLDVLSVANNHAMDAGVSGWAETVTHLNHLGIHPAGFRSGETLSQSAVEVKAKGIRLAFLAYTALDLGDMKNFSVYPFYAEAQNVEKDIRQARAKNDFVIISFHWGNEYDHLASPRQKELAQTALKAGADLVVGHHPHTLQEIHWFPKTRQLAAYSLGDFIFDLVAPSRQRKVNRSMILYVRINAATKKIQEFIPVSTYIHDFFQPIPFFEADLNSLVVNQEDGLNPIPGFELRSHLSKAQVLRIEKDKIVPYDNWKTGAVLFSPYDPQYPGEIVLHDRWQLAGDPETSVGQGAEFSHGEFRKVIWLEVPQNNTLRVAYPAVKVGRRLTGFFGFTDWATMEQEGQSVEVQIVLDAHPVYTAVLPNKPGWRNFSVDLSSFESRELPLSVEFKAADSKRRHVGFNAWFQ